MEPLQSPEDRPLGAPVPGFQPPPTPGDAALSGHYARLERLDAARHASALFAANAGDKAMWDYMYDGPFVDLAAYRSWVEVAQADTATAFYAIQNLDTGVYEGVASFLRINPAAGSIELGNIALSPALQRKRAATEAFYLMIKWALTAGYRRFEWKCNAMNRPSRRAAERLGLSYEGIFRQAAVVKGRNRDTAWYAAIDSEWPALEKAYAAWLRPENFDVDGQQKTSLRTLTAPILACRDPAL